MRLYIESVHAGFPSPADDYIEQQLDFNDYLIKHPASTFCVKVAGDSMTGAGIYPGDILVVDRSLVARNNSIIVAIVNGEFTVKRIQFRKGQIYLLPENPSYNAVSVSNENFEVWGVVTYVIHQAR